MEAEDTFSWEIVGGPEKGRVCAVFASNLLGAGVLGHSLGALRDGVLGQFTGEKESHGGLDLAAGDGGTLVVVGQLGGLTGDPLKDIHDKAVHDAHGFAGDTSVGVDLLQHFVNVDAVGFFPLLPSLLVPAGAGGLGLGHGLLGSLGCCLGCHCKNAARAKFAKPFIVRSRIERSACSQGQGSVSHWLGGTKQVKSSLATPLARSPARLYKGSSACAGD